MTTAGTLVIAIATLAAAPSAVPSDAQTSTARWTSDYKAALTAARAEGRPLLVVIEKPAEREFRVEQVSAKVDSTQAALLSSYKLCRVDATTPQGRKLAEKFDATALPYTAIVGSGRWVVYERNGAFTDRDWINMLVSYRNGQKTRRAVWSRSGLRNCFT